MFDNEPDEEESTPSGEGMSCTALSASSPKRNQEDTQKAASSDKVEQGSSPNAQPQDRSPLQQDGRQQQQSRKPEDPSEATPPPGRLRVIRGICVWNLATMVQYVETVCCCILYDQHSCYEHS